MFFDFNEAILGESNKYLNQIGRFNYLIFNKKIGLPEFLKSNMEKEEEKNVKEKFKEQYSFKEYYLEKSAVNLEVYRINGKFRRGRFILRI